MLKALHSRSMATKSSRKVGGVLREVLVVVSVRDGAGGVGDGEVLGAALAVDVVASTAVDGPVGGLVNEGSSPGVGTSGGGRPEDGAEPDSARLVGVHVRVRSGHGARAVVGEGAPVASGDLLEVADHGAAATGVLGTEPGGVTSGGPGVGGEVAVGSGGDGGGSTVRGGGGGDASSRAAGEGSTLLDSALLEGQEAADAGLDGLSLSFNGFDAAIVLHDEEAVTGGESVIVGTSGGEVVRGGKIVSESDRLARLEGGEPAILGRDLRRVLRDRAIERWVGARGAGDVEAVGVELVQDGLWIVQNAQNLAASVGQGGGDLQLLDTAERGWSRHANAQAGCSGGTGGEDEGSSNERCKGEHGDEMSSAEKATKETSFTPSSF